MSGIVLAWLIGEGIIVSRSVATAHHPPIPGQLLGSSAFFALLALIAEYPPARTSATLLAFGIDIAAFLSPSWTTPWLTPARPDLQRHATGTTQAPHTTTAGGRG